MENEYEIKDTSDLREEIMALTNYADQIKMVARAVLDDELEVNNELSAKALSGIASLIEIHRDKLLETVNQVLDGFYDL